MMTPQEKHQLCQLILKSLEETISQEEFDLLDRRPRENPDVVEYYGNCIELFVQMKKPGQFPLRLPVELHRDTVLDIAVWDQLSEYEKVAPMVEIPHIQDAMPLIQKVQVEKNHRRIVSDLIMLAAKWLEDKSLTAQASFTGTVNYDQVVQP
jgi:hypothetical protein